MENEDSNNSKRKSILLLSCILLVIGNIGGPLIMRLYFVDGGKRIWLSSWLVTSGFPVIFFLLSIFYMFRQKTQGINAKFTIMKLPTFIAASMIGILIGLGDYLYAFGIAHLPVSTSTIIGSTQLAFTAFFALLIVKQKFTPYSINAIILLSLGAVILGVHANGDRPRGETNKMYIFGFLAVLADCALAGAYIPLTELMYKKGKQALSYTLVMEVQMVMSLFATVFASVGMLVNNDFKAIPHEARESQLGETKYYVVLICTAIVWQCSHLGMIGVLLSTSSLLTGIIFTVLYPISEVVAVLVYHEKFHAEKGIALVLSLWGFVSNLYGEMENSKKKEQEMEYIHKRSQNEENPKTPSPNIVP